MGVFQIEKMSIKPVAWGPAADDHLGRISGAVEVRWYRGEWEDDRLTLYAVCYGSKRLATVAARLENKEFVIVAAGGSADFDLTKEILQYLEKIAVANGCASIRFHTARPGLIKKTALQGYSVRETIMEKDLI